MNNIVNAINLLTKAIKSVIIVGNNICASFYLSSTAGTTITAAGTYYKIAGTTVKNIVNQFTHSSNKLTYTGSNPVTARISCGISFTCDTNNVIAKSCVAVNGIALTNSESEVKVLTGTDVAWVGVRWKVVLNPGDYVEFFTTCDHAGAVLTVTKMVSLVGC